MALSVAKLAEFLNHGLNIIISGQGGTGKTQMLMAAAQKTGLTMEYMSAPTLDPYIDLLGAPVPSEPDENGKRTLEFLRKKGVIEAEVIFIDELNRAEPKTLNAVFELIQFHSINGEKLPNLKAVVAAINPVGENYVGNYELDFSLRDRFDIFLETDTAADLSYFVNVFGKTVGKALVDWHKLHDHEAKGYLSPRRLEKIGHTWLKMPEVGTLKAMVPPGGDFNVSLLHRQLTEAAKGDKIRVDPKSSLADRLPFLSSEDVRQSRAEILAEIPKMSREDLAKATEAVARTLKNGIRIPSIIRDWAPALEYFSTADKTMMMGSWTASQSNQFQKLLASEQISIGKNLVSVPKP